MNVSERQRLYKQEVATRYQGLEVRYSDAFGVSNSAKVVGGGLFAFNVNFENFTGSPDEVAVHCLLRFPPDDEIYFTIFVKDVSTLAARLAEMKAAGGSSTEDAPDELFSENEETQEQGNSTQVIPVPDGLSYTNNNKNTKGYVARDGKLYLRNKSYWDTMPEDLSGISNPVSIDRIIFAIWPPRPTPGRGLLAREFIGYIGSLIGADRVHEIAPWEDENALSAEMQRLPSDVPLSEIEASVADLGGHYPGGEIARLHGALNFLRRKHFAILSGLSGTGKTQLALQYAHAVHGLSRDERDPFLIVCPVRPEWTDPSGLTGYFDVLSNRYVVPPFLEAVLLATAHRASPVFVVLDELNLARVEYYLSDVLSAMETGKELNLHSSSVPLEGSTGSSIPSALALPPNLYLIGTINIDETTNPISDKVLDRAIVIDMSDVDLSGFLANLKTRDPDLTDAIDRSQTRLSETLEALKANGLGFGYRIAEEVVRYQQFAGNHLNKQPDDVIDDLMVEKVLVKLRGGERQRPLLASLKKVLENLTRSQNLLDRLEADLNEFGSFQVSR